MINTVCPWAGAAEGKKARLAAGPVIAKTSDVQDDQGIVYKSENGEVWPVAAGPVARYNEVGLLLSVKITRPPMWIGADPRPKENAPTQARRLHSLG